MAWRSRVNTSHATRSSSSSNTESRTGHQIVQRLQAQQRLLRLAQDRHGHPYRRVLDAREQQIEDGLCAWGSRWRVSDGSDAESTPATASAARSRRRAPRATRRRRAGGRTHNPRGARAARARAFLNSSLAPPAPRAGAFHKASRSPGLSLIHISEPTRPY